MSCTPEEALLAGNLALLGIERADMGAAAATATAASNRGASSTTTANAVDLAVARGAFRRPNARALEVVLHHLYCTMHGRAQARRAFKGCWPVVDKKQQKEFYAKVQEWLRDLREAGAFGPLAASSSTATATATGGAAADSATAAHPASAAAASSALRSASGPRVVALLSELSTAALRAEHARAFPGDGGGRRLTRASAGGDALLAAAAARDPYLAAAAAGPLLTAARVAVAREAEQLLRHASEAEALRRAAESGAAALRDRFYALTAAERRLRAAVGEAGLALPAGLEAAMREERDADDEEEEEQQRRQQQYGGGGGGGRYGEQDEDDGGGGDYPSGSHDQTLARRRAAIGVPMDLEAILDDDGGEDEADGGSAGPATTLSGATERRAAAAWQALEAQLPSLAALGPLVASVLGPEAGGAGAGAATEHPHAVDGAELQRLASAASGGGGGENGGGGGGENGGAGGGGSKKQGKSSAWPSAGSAKHHQEQDDQQQQQVDVIALLEAWVQGVEQLGGRVRQLAGELPAAPGGARGRVTPLASPAAAAAAPGAAAPSSSDAVPSSTSSHALHLRAAISAHGASLQGLRALRAKVGARLASATALAPALRLKADEGVAEEEGRWRREAAEAAEVASAANAVAFSVMLGGMGGQAEEGEAEEDDGGAGASAAAEAAAGPRQRGGARRQQQQQGLQLVPPTPVLMRLAREHAFELQDEAPGRGVAAEAIAEEEEEERDGGDEGGAAAAAAAANDDGEEEDDDDGPAPAEAGPTAAAAAAIAAPMPTLPSLPPESVVRPRRLSYAGETFATPAAVGGAASASAVGGASASASASAAAGEPSSAPETAQPPQSQLHALRARFARVAEN